MDLKDLRNYKYCVVFCVERLREGILKNKLVEFRR